MARAWHKTFELPIIITNCSNNYGPFQFPEKLIPNVILSALSDRKLTIYGTGTNVRDWLYVDDHANALLKVFQNSSVGETFNIGGNSEIKNIDIVKIICSLLDKKVPKKIPYEKQIVFVKDRPGHDFRYSINADKLKNILNWSPSIPLVKGLELTIDWYLKNESWWLPLIKDFNINHRLGINK